MAPLNSKGRLKGWPMRILVALDQLLNVLLLGLPDETLSSRAAKAARRGKPWGCILCRLLHLVDRDHCERVIEMDES